MNQKKMETNSDIINHKFFFFFFFLLTSALLPLQTRLGLLYKRTMKRTRPPAAVAAVAGAISDHAYCAFA